MTTEERSHLRTWAMYNGTGMGILWTLKFILFPIGLTVPILQLLFLALTLAVPLIGYRMVTRFRDVGCEGNLSFSRAFLYYISMFLFASMFVAVAHYVYFRFIDGGYVISTYLNMWDEIERNAATELAGSLQIYGEAIKEVASLSPLEITIQLFTNNLLSGLLLATPTALLAMRKKKE